MTIAKNPKVAAILIFLALLLFNKGITATVDKYLGFIDPIWFLLVGLFLFWKGWIRI